ncbi:MAG: hypothetical protein R3B90_01615 [Planctomycetaceae bacterium]
MAPSSRDHSSPDSSAGPLVTSQSEFDGLCDELSSAELIAFDTEFVSETTYRPLLCLLQFATADRTFAVDPFEVRDLSRWWRLMADPARRIVIHGGREEIRFCLREGGCGQ